MESIGRTIGTVNGTGRVYGVDGTIKFMNKEFNKRHKYLVKAVENVAGYLATSLKNAPARGGKSKKDSRNYRPSSKPLMIFFPNPSGGIVKTKYSVEEYLNRLKKQKDYTPQQKEQTAKRLQRQRKAVAALKTRIQKLRQRLKRTTDSDRVSRIQQRLERCNQLLSELRAKHKEINRQKRAKKIAQYKIVVARLHTDPGVVIRSEKDVMTHEMFRVPSAPGKPPKTWAGVGWADKYIGTIQHYANIQQDSLNREVSIAPQPGVEGSNPEVLQDLEFGGTMMGGSRLRGYLVTQRRTGAKGQRFKQIRVAFQRLKNTTKRQVRIQPRPWVSPTVARVQQRIIQLNRAGKQITKNSLR